MQRPVATWCDWEEPSGIRDRSQLPAVSRFTDDDIGRLYAELAKLRNAGLGSELARQRHDSLKARILAAEKERAAEIRAQLGRQALVREEDILELSQRVDAILDRH